jgi:DNA mismatch repair ATPase MutS
MGIFDEYEKLFNECQLTHGKKSIVLLQNGMFFEVYGVDNVNEKVGLVKEMSVLLQIQETRRNKAILENNRKNFLMAGFPMSQKDRYVGRLNNSGYVVVVAEQFYAAGGNIYRQITGTYPPGANIQYLLSPDNNFLLSIYIESEGKKKGKRIKLVKMMSIGLCAIDVSTGYNILSETYNDVYDENLAFDGAFKFIQMLQPKEILINTRNFEFTKEELLSYLELKSDNILVRCNFDKIPKEHYKLSYQNEFLKKVFPTKDIISPIESLNLESFPTAIISYLSLLNHCYAHNENILKDIEKPHIWQSSNYLNLDNNCINQLNIIPDTKSSTYKYDSILSLIDNASTPMGKRLLKHRLTLPITNIRELNKRYDSIEIFSQKIKEDKPSDIDKKLKQLSGHKNLYFFQKFEPLLTHISDIERYHRKICLELLNPSEFSNLNSSYQQILEIIMLLKTQSTKKLIQKNLMNNFIAYIYHYEKVLNIEEASKYNLNNITGSFFHKGYDVEIDKIQEEIEECVSYFDNLCSIISFCIAEKSKATKFNKKIVNYDTTDGIYYIEITTARYNTFIRNARNL